MPKRIKDNLIAFFSLDISAGILLMVATILALIINNSPFEYIYDGFKHIPVAVQFADFKIDKPLLLWINDGLMAIFFLLVGLEIKREVLEGHLSKPSQISLPAIAAAGGIIVPAIIYAAINWHTPETVKGWAIPAATDIAFALGILLLLGNRIPTSLKVCLVAIAIIDDLAAILIIALFYTSHLKLFSLGLALIGVLLGLWCNKRGVTNLSVYGILGIFIWACVLKSGVHATLAGVVLGLIIPMRIEDKNGKSPLVVAEHALHPWVNFAVIPLFAFANAGVSLSGISLGSFAEPITLGIMFGLFFGKQVGVMFFTFLGKTLKLCDLPAGTNWKQYYGMAVLTGIGFTMSLFIGTLAFPSEMQHANDVRLGVLGGSILSAIVGVTLLLMFTENKKEEKAS